MVVFSPDKNQRHTNQTDSKISASSNISVPEIFFPSLFFQRILNYSSCCSGLHSATADLILSRVTYWNFKRRIWLHHERVESKVQALEINSSHTIKVTCYFVEFKE